MIGQSHRLHLTLLPSTPPRSLVGRPRRGQPRLPPSLLRAGRRRPGRRRGVLRQLRCLTGPLLIVLFAAVAGLIAAILAIARSGERGLLLVLPILWGLVVASFALGEFDEPDTDRETRRDDGRACRSAPARGRVGSGGSFGLPGRVSLHVVRGLPLRRVPGGDRAAGAALAAGRRAAGDRRRPGGPAAARPARTSAASSTTSSSTSSSTRSTWRSSSWSPSAGRASSGGSRSPCTSSGSSVSVLFLADRRARSSSSLFPNVFEPWFLLVALLHHRRRPVAWTAARLAAALAGVTALKLVQEWALHGGADLRRDLVAGVPRRSSALADRGRLTAHRRAGRRCREAGSPRAGRHVAEYAAGMDRIRIVDVTDAASFGLLPPCADPSFDHRTLRLLGGRRPGVEGPPGELAAHRRTGPAPSRPRPPAGRRPTRSSPTSRPATRHNPFAPSAPRRSTRSPSTTTTTRSTTTRSPRSAPRARPSAPAPRPSSPCWGAASRSSAATPRCCSCRRRRRRRRRAPGRVRPVRAALRVPARAPDARPLPAAPAGAAPRDHHLRRGDGGGPRAGPRAWRWWRRSARTSPVAASRPSRRIRRSGRPPMPRPPPHLSSGSGPASASSSPDERYPVVRREL